jgi:hypothetical protein
MDARHNKVGWLTMDVKVYGGREVLNVLATQGSQKFHDKWSFIPSNTRFDTMQAHKYLIPIVIIKHIENVKQGGQGLYDCHCHRIQGNGGGN